MRLFSKFTISKTGGSLLGLALVLISAVSPAYGSDKTASVKITRGDPFRGKTTLALGAFRVAFITDDSVTSVNNGVLTGHGGAAIMSGEIVGIEHPLMQKIADQVYADFVKQATAKGYTVIESKKLAEISQAYRELPEAENFATGRLGTFVTPTGQRPVTLAADDSAKAQKGAGGFTTGFHNIAAMTAKSEANKVFPEAAKDADATVLGVTIVVNFANFRGGRSAFASSARLTTGATIDGRVNTAAIGSTVISGWDAKTLSCARCEAEAVLEGQIHSNVSVGDVSTRSDMKRADHLANAIASLSGTAQTNKKKTTIDADPVAYETNVLLVAAEASELLLNAMSKAK